MNRDDQFEKRLSRQPVKPLPPAWRAEILAAAEQAATSRTAQRADYSWFANLRSQLAGMLWPSPSAWAALGAAWVLILVLNFNLRETAPDTFVRNSGVGSPRMEGALKQKQRMFAELAGFGEIREADRPKSLVPRPRSQGRSDSANA